MPNILDANGLQTATQQELINLYTTALKTIYGSSIDLDSDTPDGQWMNIIIQSVLDVENLLTQINSGFDPDQAIGVTLDQRCAINGIQRMGGTYTITNVTVVTTSSVNLFGLDQSTQPVFTVQDASGNQWELITTQLGVSAGTNVFAFQAASPGAVISIPNTITIPVTIVLGVQSVNNPTSYTTLGINAETDAALRVRRAISVSLSSQGYLRGLEGALENITGVTNAIVYENTSNTTDSRGIPGHSIWVIIAGTPNVALASAWSATTTYSYGQLASSAGVNYISWMNNNLNHPVTDTAFWGVYSPVAQAIYAKRNAGCGMKGSTSYIVTQLDGTQFTIYWDFVIQEPLFIKFTTQSLNGVNPPNIAAIVQQLPSIYTPGVFSEVNINQLATYVQQIDPNTLVTSPGFSTSSGGSYTNTLTPTAENYQFQVSSADIIVLPMIMSAPNVTYTFSSGTVTQTNATVAHGGSTIQFTGLGGYGTYSYSLVSGTGSINPTTGLYTSSSIGTDVVEVTDFQAHTATCQITVT